jgi:methylenetetrahydrofolate reductase (NADPH)
MRIPDLLREDEPSFSFEFFPPKTEEASATLFENVAKLAQLEPDFVSVTYGAAGSTRDGTVQISERIKREFGIETMAHLSCVGETVEGLEAILDRLGEAGVENILALRGDPPRGATNFVAPEGGLKGSAELAAFIRERTDWGIGGSSFPDVHPEAASPQADIDYLKRKVEGGAEFLITQLFFDNAVFFDWLDRVRAAGIEVPVFAGILPVRSYSGLVRFCEICDAKIPRAVHDGLRLCDGDPLAERTWGIAYAARQSEELLAAGVDGIHFYPLNHADSTMAVLGALRAARPWERSRRRTAAGDARATSA